MLSPGYIKKLNYWIVLILILFCFPVVSQENYSGVPDIINFKSKDYGYESQNYDIVQSDEGIMYFSNVSGILEYDNSNWDIIRTNGSPKMDKGCTNKIYVADIDDIGYIRNTNKGSVFITIKDPGVETGHLKSVVALCGEAFFASDTCIYHYSNNKLSRFYSHNDNLEIFKVGAQLLVWLSGKGLFRYKNERLVEITGGIDFKDYKPKAACIFRKKIFIKPGRSNGIYYFDDKVIKRFKTEVDKEIESGIVTSVKNYRNKYLIIGTEVNGLFIIDNSGNLVFHLNKSTGLADNHISNLFIDNNYQLWVSTYNGISYVKLSSPFTYYNSDERLNVSILSINKYKNKYYFSTNQGLYYSDFNDIYSNADTRSEIMNKSLFKKVQNLNIRVKNIEIIDNHLYACTDYGIYLIKNNEAKFLMEGETETMHKSGFYQDQVYIAGAKGLYIVSINDKGELDVKGKVKNLNYRLRTIAETINGDLWLGSNKSGVFNVDFSESNQLNAEVELIKKSAGLPSDYDWIDVYNTKNGVIFSTYKGVFRYKGSKGFVEDKLIGYDFRDSERWIYPVFEDKYGNLWYSSGVKNEFRKQTAVALFQGKGEPYRIKKEPFQQISQNTIESIFVDKNDIVWYGSLSGIIRYKKNKNVAEKELPNCVIRHISIEKDTVLLEGGLISNASSQRNTQILRHKQNNIKFEFTAPFYESGENVKYQTKLLGLQDNWSEWGKVNIKEYTNLKNGEYIFQVRAKGSNNQITDISSFKFQIKPPVYLSWWALFFYLALITSFVYMYLRRKEYRHTREKYRLENIIAKRTEDLLKQKEQTERLVDKILPKSTLEEIRSKGKASSKRFEMVTVLFADIQGFTSIVQKTKPEMLIKRLDRTFKAFDQMIEKYNIEKIKTIGDAYMCAGGIPYENSTNPIEVVMAALEMQHIVKKIKNKEEVDFDIRIGIHTGPVIAGVVGTHKIAYDIWGDTVNIANRMESNSEISNVNISAETYRHVKDFFTCTYRGKKEIKQIGDIEMYFVKGIHLELAKDKKRIEPNNDFIIKTQIVRLRDLQNHIFEKLEKNLPKNLYYHNVKHTVNVYYQTEMIAGYEGVGQEEMLILKTAALMHDIGYLVSYDEHEEKGIEITKKTLPSYSYNESQIEKICELIMATKMPHKPKNLLEEIICDADLDYLGRPDFMPTSQNLFRELFERNKIDNIEQWNKMQMKFMEKHKYFTATARREREPEKQKRLAELKQII